MATKPALKGKASNLEALREHLKGLDLGGGGKGFWSPKEGKQTIRILPPVGEMTFFFQSVGRHFFPGKRYVVCPSFTTDNQRECPVCEVVKALYQGGKPEKSLAEQMGKRRSFWMNVVVRGRDGDEGPFIYTPGSMVFDPLIQLINDPDYGDITDIDEGHDITIERSGSGLKTEYGVIPRPKKTPLSDDPDEIESWLEKAKDLSWVEAPDDKEDDKEVIGDRAVYILPYDRIVEEFGLENVDEMDASDYDKAEQPARKPPAKPVAKSPKRHVDEDAGEDGEDDNGEENNEEDDDEAEDIRKTIQRRRAVRKSGK
jgi:hypothetical protein